MADSAAPVLLVSHGAETLGPLAHLRNPADVRTGALTLRERLKIAGFSVVFEVDASSAEGLSEATGRLNAGAEDLIAVSSRAVLAPAALSELALGEVVVEPGSGEPVAARLGRGEIERFLDAGSRSRAAAGPSLLHRPWDVVRFRDAMLAHDLSLIVTASDRWARERPAGTTLIGEKRLAIDPSAEVMPTAVFDLTKGPVLVERGATIRPGAIVHGPAYVGPGSSVLDGALVKANTAIGPVCKVAGEVGGTIFQGFANKAHDGHLGDSWVGEWVNLGAGTMNSNLLNTYGEVAARRDHAASRERTGLTFLGAIIGDHVKTAIGTRIFTGSVIGTGAMIASSAPPAQATPPFAWVTDAGVKTFRVEKFLEVAQAAMGRRGVEMTPEMESRLRGLHERTTA